MNIILKIRQRIRYDISLTKVVEVFDRAFNNGLCWVIQADSDNFIDVVMIYQYYQEMRMHNPLDGDDVYSNMGLNCIKDERILKLFLPKELLWRSDDDDFIYGLGFMRGVVAGVEHLDLLARLREQYHRGIREYDGIGSDDAAAVGKTATETRRPEGPGSRPPVLQ